MSRPRTEATAAVVAAVPDAPGPRPQTMPAVRLLQQGGPQGLQIGEVDVPVPETGEVLVRVRTVAANRLDLNAMGGSGPGALAALPRVVGIDPAGTVVAVGAATDPELVGRQVVVKPAVACGCCGACRAREEADCTAQTLIGVHRDGGAAQYVAVPARNVFDATGIEPAVATVAVHSAPVALHALRAGGGPLAGTTVLVTGSSGAVGRAAVQIAAHAGAHVLAASTSTDVTDGGALPVRHVGPDDLVEAVRAAAPGGVDLAVDGSGIAGLTSAAARCLAWRGCLVVVGSSDGGTIELDARALYLGRRRVIGAASAGYADVADALALVRDGAIRPVVGPRFPLDRARDAYAAVLRRDRAGKVIIDVS